MLRIDRIDFFQKRKSIRWRQNGAISDLKSIINVHLIDIIYMDIITGEILRQFIDQYFPPVGGEVMG